MGPRASSPLPRLARAAASLALLSAGLLAGAAPARAAEAAAAAPSKFAGKRIGRIAVDIGDVFDVRRPKENKALFRWANRVHMDTREAVVRRELLFKEGDPYDEDLIEETERNLRRLPFLRLVSVEPVPGDGGAVDVRVTTWDAWTIDGLVSYRREAGRDRWSAGLTERNFAGLGKEIRGEYNSPSPTERVFGFRDPQFLGRRMVLTGDYVDQSALKSVQAQVTRPFFATIAPLSWSASAKRSDAELPVSDLPGAAQARRLGTGGEFGVAAALDPSPKRIRRVGATVGTERVEWRQTAGGNVALPGDASVHVLDLNGRVQRVRFAKESNITRLFRDEDVDLGPGVIPGLALRPSWLGAAQTRVEPRVGLRGGRRLARGHFALAYADVGTSYGGGRWQTFTVGLEGQHYWRDLRRQTIASRVLYEFGPALESFAPYALGENRGLRGYGFDTFKGTRRALVSVEDRVVFWEDLFALVSLGGAVFFDAGYAWPRGEGFDLTDLRPALGAGLRIGPSRAGSGEPLRFDVAYGLRDNGLGSRWTVVIVSKQAFGPRE